MRIISRLVLLVLLVTMLNVPVFAADTLSGDELINLYVDKVIALEHKEMFIELLKVVQDVNDAQGLMIAYNSAFSSLSGGQQDQLNTMSDILMSMAVIKDNIFNLEFNVDLFADYIGLGADRTPKKDLLVAKLKTQEATIVNSLGTLSQSELDNGFSRLNKLFDLLKDVKDLKSLQIAQMFSVSSSTSSDMALISESVDLLVAFIGLKSSSLISDTTSIKAGMNQFVNYYNQTASINRSKIFTYFDTYGLIKVGTSTTNNGGGTPPVVPGGTSAPSGDLPNSELLEDIDTEVIPEGLELFGDIGNVSWAWTAIRQLYIAEVIKGKSVNKFEPQTYISRGEFASLLTRMFDLNTTTSVNQLEDVFTDVNSNHWFYKDVMATYQLGYIKGFGNNKFNPNGLISREQIATILERVLSEKGIKSSTTDYSKILNQFADATTVSDWAIKGTSLLSEKNIITGTLENKIKFFNFKKYTTRAEVSVMLYRIAGLVETKIKVIEEKQ